MTDERLYDILSDMLEQISRGDYPQTYDVIEDSISEGEGTVLDEPMEIAGKLHHADGAKQLPDCVVDFLLDVYTDEMKKGNADAACDIGSLYYTGRGGEQSYAKAVKYYTIAARDGSRQAQENLGYCYYYGRNVPVDYEKAFHYFALGAFDGHLRSLYKIGDMYRYGYYVEKNEQEAFCIYLSCIRNMTQEAEPLVGADVLMRMGDCYFEGIGTEKNDEMAMFSYQRAEQLFMARLMDGDFMIRKCYDHVVTRQAKVRARMKAKLPVFDWTKTK